MVNLGYFNLPCAIHESDVRNMDSRIKQPMHCVKIDYWNRYRVELRWVLFDILKATRRNPDAVYWEVIYIMQARSL